MRPLSRLVLITALLAASAGVARAQLVPGRIGPDLGITGNGRALHPAGRLTTLGNFPTGGALSPDGRFFWAVDSGDGRNDVKVVDVVSGDVVQSLPLPGGYGGAAFAPDGHTAYVSGEPNGGTIAPEGPTKGDDGNVIHVVGTDPANGQANETN